jgi:hypothetical protein
LCIDPGLRRIEDVAALHHLPHDVGVDRIGLRIVVDVSVETVHHVEVRIAEQLLQRLPLQCLVDLRLEKRRKIGIDRQRLHRRQRVLADGIGGRSRSGGDFLRSFGR